MKRAYHAKLHEVLTPKNLMITLPNVPKYYHFGDAMAARISQDPKSQLDSKIALGAYNYLIKHHTYHIQKGYCSFTDKPLNIHYCGWLDSEGIWSTETIAVMKGYDNKKSINYRCLHKVCICDVEIRE